MRTPNYTPRVHLATERRRYVFPRPIGTTEKLTLCGVAIATVQAGKDRAAVTCRRCLRRLAEAEACAARTTAP
jgi:hypothetical protein